MQASAMGFRCHCFLNPELLVAAGDIVILLQFILRFAPFETEFTLPWGWCFWLWKIEGLAGDADFPL